MKKNILYLVVILAMCQGMFAMKMTQEERDLFEEKINEIRRLATAGHYDEAYGAFEMLGMSPRPSAREGIDPKFYSSMMIDLYQYIYLVREVTGKNKFWTLRHEAQQLVKQGKLEEAQDKYIKLKAAYDNVKADTPPRESTTLYENAIADLEKAISQAQTK